MKTLTLGSWLEVSAQRCTVEAVQWRRKCATYERIIRGLLAVEGEPEHEAAFREAREIPAIARALGLDH